MADTDIFGYAASVGTNHFTNMGDKSAAFTLKNDITLVQQWQVGYQQSVTPIYECGSAKVYYSSKHGSGTLTVGRIVSDKGLDYKDWGTPCKPEPSASLTATEGCDGNSSVTLTIEGLILTSVGFSGNAQNAYVSENLSVMFASLKAVSSGAGGGGAGGGQ